MSSEKSQRKMRVGILAATVIVILILGFGAGYYYGTTSVPAAPAKTVTVTVTPEKITYVIGVALPYSGPLASYGKDFRDSVILAVDEINALLARSRSAVTFEIASADTETTALGASKAVRTLYETKRVQIIVGPLTTSEVLGAKEFSDANKIVLLCPASTGLGAAIPGDFIFRVVDPPDNYQGLALAQAVSAEGYQNVVVAYRDDTFGVGIWEIFSKRFSEIGGKSIPLKFAPDQPDYSGEVSKLASLVSDAQKTGSTAVLFVAWEGEALKWFPHAQVSPVLKNVRWYGIENLKSYKLLPPETSKETGDFLAGVKFTVTSFYTPGNPLTPSFPVAFKQKYGREPLPYSDGAYDATYIAAWSILVAGKYDGKAIADVLPTVAGRFIGVTVQTYLDPNGDQAIAYFGIYRVSAAYKFELVGTFDGSTGKITWLTR